MNYTGQLGGLVTEKTAIPIRYQILKYNGRPFTTTETYHALKKVLLEKASARQVLSHGA
jgi:2-oxoglutarate ferredoxin oxidoreductase subunit alpha